MATFTTNQATEPEPPGNEGVLTRTAIPVNEPELPTVSSGSRRVGQPVFDGVNEAQQDHLYGILWPPR